MRAIPGQDDHDDGQVTIWFSTAWSPCIPWLVATAEQFPELNFRLVWSDPMIPFSGYMTAHGTEHERHDFKPGTEAVEFAKIGLPDWGEEFVDEIDDEIDDDVSV